MASSNSKSIVYIDGFNLYYGTLRGSPHKWLNLQRYFELLSPNDNLQLVKYFTAYVTGAARKRQEAYLNALETLPLVNVILGRFKNRNVDCRVTGCSYSSSRRFLVPEEKRTDVNVAVHMIDDAYQGICDKMILVTGDSDLVPAVDMVKLRFPEIEVFAYIPARNKIRGAAVELRNSVDRDRLLPLNILPHAQFPANVPDGVGGTITKPASW